MPDLMADPTAWLLRKGFDPGSLSKVIGENDHSFEGTAMYAAAEAGEVEVCIFIFEQGAVAAATIRRPRSME
jgi:hypothetical protein